MLIVLLIFLVLLVCAYAAYALLPHPFGLIVAVIVGLVALFYLVSNIGELEGADAAVTLARSSWG
jgi:VIT1/CCC1 family predicted Fe2+/Mn2+ transporter